MFVFVLKRKAISARSVITSETDDAGRICHPKLDKRHYAERKQYYT
jgi:hypothetical protein